MGDTGVQAGLPAEILKWREKRGAALAGPSGRGLGLKVPTSRLSSGSERDPTEPPPLVAPDPPSSAPFVPRLPSHLVSLLISGT